MYHMGSSSGHAKCWSLILIFFCFEGMVNIDNLSHSWMVNCYKVKSHILLSSNSVSLSSLVFSAAVVRGQIPAQYMVQREISWGRVRCSNPLSLEWSQVAESCERLAVGWVNLRRNTGRSRDTNWRWGSESKRWGVLHAERAFCRIFLHLNLIWICPVYFCSKNFDQQIWCVIQGWSSVNSATQLAVQIWTAWILQELKCSMS